MKIAVITDSSSNLSFEYVNKIKNCSLGKSNKKQYFRCFKYLHHRINKRH